MNDRFGSDLNKPHSSGGSFKILWWILGGLAAFVILMLVTALGGLVYIGSVGPETSVYLGNRIPARFVATAKEVGALNEGEKLQFFYSDALTDIRDGFYFVSDQKIATYSNEYDPPLDVVAFADIETAELLRDESFWDDSEIYLELKNGQYYSIPVSSEKDRDKLFFEAILKRTNIQAEQTSSD